MSRLSLLGDDVKDYAQAVGDDALELIRAMMRSRNPKLKAFGVELCEAVREEHGDTVSPGFYLGVYGPQHVELNDEDESVEVNGEDEDEE